MKNINEILLNPVRMRIIQELSTRDSATANELCEKISDVPRTTMYRHIKILIENKILSVISEEKVRGSLERTIALNIPEITKHNTVENAAENALGFLLSNYTKFHRYFNAENPDPGKDMIFLNNTVLMMNDPEFEQFLNELRQLLLKYSFDVGEDRKTRDISIISAPVED
ncbi:helix-turn-helix domain-containing protein [Gudongella sp. DL1XJH-153]|uniref:helix-turn-helix domain-containing protein n=1 Tax=Gudongella sp. DL1XJH-153 TaxID=3409804 RepID=UPI003BB782CA